MFKYYTKNQGKFIIVGILSAFILAIYLPNLFNYLLFISDTFINLLKLCALPIVCTSLVVILGGMKTPNQIKVIARNSIFYILVSEIVAVTIGILVFNFVNVGKGVDGTSLLNGASFNGVNNSHIGINHIFTYIFTGNIFESLVKFDVLPLVIFSIMFGITCSFNQEKAKPMLDFFRSTREIFLNLLNVVMLLAPLAIFVLVGNSVASSYLNGSLSSNLYGLLKFVGVFFGALFIHFLWQIILVILLYKNKLILVEILFKAVPIFVTAFVSSSSLATLPIAMEKAESLGGNKKVVEFMLPICASMNFASGMMYEVAATLFFAQILGVHLSIESQVLLAVVCILTGIAVGGIPETSMVSFITVFNLVGVPLSAISILMPLDRIIDRVRTIVNIFGNTCGTLVVSKLTQDDIEAMQHEI